MSSRRRTCTRLTGGTDSAKRAVGEWHCIKPLESYEGTVCKQTCMYMYMYNYACIWTSMPISHRDKSYYTACLGVTQVVLSLVFEATVLHVHMYMNVCMLTCTCSCINTVNGINCARLNQKFNLDNARSCVASVIHTRTCTYLPTLADTRTYMYIIIHIYMYSCVYMHINLSVILWWLYM